MLSAALWSCPHLHRQAQQVLHHANLSIGRCSVEGGVTPLVLAADLPTLRHQQTQDVQMSCGGGGAVSHRASEEKASQAATLTHVSGPVQSSAVLLVKGVVVGSF